MDIPSFFASATPSFASKFGSGLGKFHLPVRSSMYKQSDSEIVLYLAAILTYSPLQAALLTYSHFRIRILRQAQPAAPPRWHSAKRELGAVRPFTFQVPELYNGGLYSGGLYCGNLYSGQLIQWELIL